MFFSSVLGLGKFDCSSSFKPSLQQASWIDDPHNIDYRYTIKKNKK